MKNTIIYRNGKTITGYKFNAEDTASNIMLGGIFTSAEYAEARESGADGQQYFVTLSTLRKYGYAYPVAAAEKWIQDEDGYPLKVWEYGYTIDPRFGRRWQYTVKNGNMRWL